jgi:putative pyruvate formate lyase activating enzyme
MSSDQQIVDTDSRVASERVIHVTQLSDRFRVLNDGRLEVVDPRPSDVPLIRQFNPAFALKTARLPGFGRPRILGARETGCEIEQGDLVAMATSELWTIHDTRVLAARTAPASFSTKASADRRPASEACLLEVKSEIARRLASKCTLCARACGVDRSTGERGACGLGIEAVVAERYVHVAEEPPINPSYVVSLAGCGLRCIFCQQFPLLQPKRFDRQLRDRSIWTDALDGQARSLSFVGGNPDESLPGILVFLNSVPDGWPLPLVWNNHAYSTPDVIRLLDGVVDAYVPDLKFGSDSCGRSLAGVANYGPVAHAAIGRMAAQDVPVIIRILVLPGHLECCHRPALGYIAGLPGRVLVSVRGQYSPDHLVRSGDPCDRRPTQQEIQAVKAFARDLELRDVDDIAP